MQTALDLLKRMYVRPVLRGVSCTLVLATLFSTGCATPPPPTIETRAQIIQRDGRVGLGLAPQFEAQLEFRRDTEVSVYLRQLAEKLMNTQPELQGSAVGVFVIRDAAKWWNFGLPGVRIYLSAGFLRSVQYENQVAAAIAMELAYVLRRDVVKRIEQNQALAQQQAAFATDGTVAAAGDPASAAGTAGATAPDAASKVKPIEYTGPNGIFIFPESVRIDAIQLAVDILYKAGYDPRGLVELWKIYENHRARSPFELNTLEKLTEESRTAVASFAPLRNPIVKSDRFTVIQERIRRL